MGLGFNVQAGGLGEFSLPSVKRKKAIRFDEQGRGDVKHVEVAHAKFEAVAIAQFIRLSKNGIILDDGQLNKSFRCIVFELEKSPRDFCEIYVFFEHQGPNSVLRF
jgi:hypothetical protein